MNILLAAGAFLYFQAREDKAKALANEILLDIEPEYQPQVKSELCKEDRERLENLLNRVDMVARGAENATSTVKDMKKGGS